MTTQSLPALLMFAFCLVSCVPLEAVVTSSDPDVGDGDGDSELPCCICDGVWCPCDAPPELWCPDVEQGWPLVCLDACGV